MTATRIPPPLNHPVIGKDGLVTVPWASYYRALSLDIDTGVAVSAIAWNYTATSSNTTAAIGDWLDVDATGGNKTITIPSASTAGYTGKTIQVSKADSSANTVTLSAASGINGSGTYVLNFQHDSVTIGSTGTEWRVM